MLQLVGKARDVRTELTRDRGQDSDHQITPQGRNVPPSVDPGYMLHVQEPRSLS
jgi:hypothetical protein